MTELRIFTPTYGRVHDQKSLKTLHPKLHRLVTLFVRKSEEVEILKVVKELAGDEPHATVVALPTKYTKHGYISAMQFLFKYAEGSSFIYMDDDITALRRTTRFFKNAPKDDKRLVQEQSRWYNAPLLTAEGQLELLQAIFDGAHAPNVATCSARPPHITPAGRLMRANGIMTAQHTVMFVAMNVPAIEKAGVQWGKHEGKELHSAISDALFNLQLLNAGLDCRYDCRYSFDAVPMFGGQGGITADEGEARKQRVLEAHDQLHALFPTAVRKKSKTERRQKTDYINIPFLFQRAKFLRDRRNELDPDGVIFQPENDVRMLENWTAWGHDLAESGRFKLWVRESDRQLHIDSNAKRLEKYNKEMKAWKAKHGR